MGSEDEWTQSTANNDLVRVCLHLRALGQVKALTELTDAQQARIAAVAERLIQGLEEAALELTAPAGSEATWATHRGPEWGAPSNWPSPPAPGQIRPPRPPRPPRPQPARPSDEGGEPMSESAGAPMTVQMPSMRPARAPRMRTRLPWDTAGGDDDTEEERPAAPPPPAAPQASRGPALRPFEAAGQQVPEVLYKPGLGEGLTSIVHRVMRPLLDRDARWDETRLGVQAIMDANPEVNAHAPEPGVPLNIGPMLFGFGFDAQGEDLRGGDREAADDAQQEGAQAPARQAAPGQLTHTLKAGEDIRTLARDLVTRAKGRTPTESEVQVAIDTLARLNPEVNVHHLEDGAELRLPGPNISMNPV